MAEMVATARKPIVGGNWKCNPASASKLPELMKNFEGCVQCVIARVFSQSLSARRARDPPNRPAPGGGRGGRVVLQKLTARRAGAPQVSREVRRVRLPVEPARRARRAGASAERHPGRAAELQLQGLRRVHGRDGRRADQGHGHGHCAHWALGAPRRVRPADAQGDERAPGDQARVHPRGGPHVRLLHRRGAADPREGHRGRHRRVRRAAHRHHPHPQGARGQVARRHRVRARVGHRHGRLRDARARAGDARGAPRLDLARRRQRDGGRDPHPVRRQASWRARARGARALRRMRGAWSDAHVCARVFAGAAPTPRTRPRFRRAPISTASSSAARRSSPRSSTSSPRSPSRAPRAL